MPFQPGLLLMASSFSFLVVKTTVDFSRLFGITSACHCTSRLASKTKSPSCVPREILEACDSSVCEISYRSLPGQQQ